MTRPTLPLFVTLAAAAMLPGLADAADARAGVHARHGEMTVLRDVHARHAYRQVPKGMALIVDPTPNREINNGLGLGEMSDADFATISSGQTLSQLRSVSGIDATVNNAIGVGLGTGQVQHSGTGVGGTPTGPLGTVGATTRGISGHVTGALSNLPFGKSGQGGP
ncbi:hypothetical protein BGP89_04705 [Luteimonas sp. JM171]|uniref:hypothetical protein n=1 Tax=Luteimonas sp. JM171 TaxID=1896164 RepID=UPI0008578235|nr:hypothetical protein [Luteimonas sp. JM171]AOH35746.1 hypothetical protein BGP89_04705 [Luteimonas sp. JM171]